MKNEIGDYEKFAIKRKKRNSYKNNIINLKKIPKGNLNNIYIYIFIYIYIYNVYYTYINIFKSNILLIIKLFGELCRKD